MHMLTHGVMGTLFGAFTGLFLSSMSHSDHTLAPTANSVRQVLKEMLSKTGATAKSFGMIGALFSGAECVVEGWRGKHDVFNVMAAGCWTGAFLSRHSGPSGMAVGCAGFSAFSTAIELVLNKTADDE